MLDSISEHYGAFDIQLSIIIITGRIQPTATKVSCHFPLRPQTVEKLLLCLFVIMDDFSTPLDWWHNPVFVYLWKIASLPAEAGSSIRATAKRKRIFLSSAMKFSPQAVSFLSAMPCAFQAVWVRDLFLLLGKWVCMQAIDDIFNNNFSWTRDYIKHRSVSPRESSIVFKFFIKPTFQASSARVLNHISLRAITHQLILFWQRNFTLIPTATASKHSFFTRLLRSGGEIERRQQAVGIHEKRVCIQQRMLEM